MARQKLNWKEGAPLNEIPIWMILHFSGDKYKSPFVLKPGVNPGFAGCLLIDPVTLAIYTLSPISYGEEEKGRALAVFEEVVDDKSLESVDLTRDKDLRYGQKYKNNGEDIMLLVDTQALGKPDKMLVTTEVKGKTKAFLAEKLFDDYGQTLRDKVPNYDKEIDEYKKLLERRKKENKN